MMMIKRGKMIMNNYKILAEYYNKEKLGLICNVLFYEWIAPSDFSAFYAVASVLRVSPAGQINISWTISTIGVRADSLKSE